MVTLHCQVSKNSGAVEASLAFIPPYWARHLFQVASEIFLGSATLQVNNVRHTAECTTQFVDFTENANPR